MVIGKRSLVYRLGAEYTARAIRITDFEMFVTAHGDGATRPRSGPFTETRLMRWTKVREEKSAVGVIVKA